MPSFCAKERAIELSDGEWYYFISKVKVHYGICTEREGPGYDPEGGSGASPPGPGRPDQIFLSSRRLRGDFAEDSYLGVERHGLVGQAAAALATSIDR